MKNKQFVNLVAYISIAFIALSLILGKVLGALEVGAALVHALDLIAQIIAYSITAVFAFFFAKSRKNIGWLIAYVVFVVAIVIFMIIK